MSYIRCLSNPEGLYIYANVRGQVEICIDQEILLMPRHVFHGIMNRWMDHWEDISYRGARLVELHPVDEPGQLFGRGEYDWRWRLTYSGWSRQLIMWQTTLFYIANNVEGRK